MKSGQCRVGLDHPEHRLPATSAAGVRRRIAVGSTLFEPGDERWLYRVEKGAICHYARREDGQHELIEFCFPGEVIGLGGSAGHVSTARAMIDTEVSVVTEEDFERALSEDSLLFFRLAEASDREFQYVKRRSLRSAEQASPIQRLANYILALLSIGVAEGKETIIAEDVSSAYVAEQLQMSPDTLSAAIASLQHSGIVEVSDSGLRIRDIAELEKLSLSGVRLRYS